MSPRLAISNRNVILKEA